MRHLRHIFFLFIGLLFHCFVYSQQEPRNIGEIVTYLSKTIPKDIQEEIQVSVSLDTLMFTIPMRMENSYPIRQWMKNKTSGQKHPVIAYFNDLGVNENEHIELIILTAFRDYLNKKPLSHEKLLISYRELEKKSEQEEKVRFITDTLDGEYIPKDLEDCIRQIDLWWSDSVKQEIKGWTEDKFLGTTHHGFGTGLRNGWQLWGGSRLSKYFNQLGINHPDDMSGIILTSYYRRLVGKDLDVAGQIEVYKRYWLITQKPLPKDYPKGVAKIDFDMGLNYKGPKHGEGYLHIGSIAKSKDIWLYDYHLGWKKINKVLLDNLLKTKKEMMEETLIALYSDK